MSKSYKDELRQKIESGPGWQFVFSQLTDAFDNAIANRGFAVDCPFPGRHKHSGGINRFRLFDDFDTTGMGICTCCPHDYWDAFDLLIEAGVGNFSQVLGKIKQLLENNTVNPAKSICEKALSREERAAQRHALKNTVDKVEWRRNFLINISKQLLPLDHIAALPARKYYEKRGLPLAFLSKWVKFHPNLEYYKRDKNGSVKVGASPAIVSTMANGDKPVTLHRIYITRDGEKETFGLPGVRGIKEVFSPVYSGSLNGSSIRLYNEPGCKTLNVTEGQEVGWSLYPILKESVHACYSAAVLTHLNVSRNEYEHVRIWADYDPYTILDNGCIKGGAGLLAAFRLEKKLLSEGFRVHVCIPKPVADSKKIDWEDIVVQSSVYLHQNDKDIFNPEIPFPVDVLKFHMMTDKEVEFLRGVFMSSDDRKINASAV